MGALTGLTIVKRFTYRGDTNEEFSNQYHFDGSVPADSTAWRALFDAMVTLEKTIYPSGVNVVRGYGYATDVVTDPSVWSVDMTVSPNSIVPGTASVTSSTIAPGDGAVWVRWKTSRNNSRGKPIYLRKYFHPAIISGTTGGDNVQTAQKTSLDTFGTKMFDGTLIDGRKIRSRSHAETILSRTSSTYVTTRTLKRRGKRPGS